MKKKKTNKGFTLMEMLIVVAIMAVLVAIAVPTMMQNINNTKSTADDANLRAAKSVANTQYMMNEETFLSTMYYDIIADDYVVAPPSPYGLTQENSAKVISAVWNSSTKAIDVQWVEP